MTFVFDRWWRKTRDSPPWRIGRRWKSASWMSTTTRLDFQAFIITAVCMKTFRPARAYLKYVLITCFYESWIFYLQLGFFLKTVVFSIKTVILAFYNLFWFLNENPFRTDQNKRQHFMESQYSGFHRFRIRENMWWARYKSRILWLKVAKSQ